jgi:hypothetical protein
MQVAQASAITLVQGLLDPFETQVDAHAKLVGVCGGVSGKEVAVAATDLKHETRLGRWQYGCNLDAQCGETSGVDGFEYFARHGDVKG